MVFCFSKAMINIALTEHLFSSLNDMLNNMCSHNDAGHKGLEELNNKIIKCSTTEKSKQHNCIQHWYY